MKSPTAFPVFYRTYSRFVNGKREDWAQVTDRVVQGMIEVGDLTPEEAALLTEQQLLLHALPSGRMLWVGGTEWSKKPENFPGSYNCSSTNIDSFNAMASMMNLAMMGTGTGANLEHKYVNKLPPITTSIDLSIANNAVDNANVYTNPKVEKWEREYTGISITRTDKNSTAKIIITVGDSRKGWVDAYEQLLLIASSGYGQVNVVIDLSHVRPTGQKLKGFGGVANPIRLPDLFINVAKITNNAIGRKLTPTDCAKIIGSAAMAVVAGNIRRSAGINQFDSNDLEAATSKDDLWVETDGIWAIDPERDMLRLANHTIVYHQKPTLEQCIESVTKQYHSGEGAIMWAGEAVARANADLLNSKELKEKFLASYPKSADSLTVEQTGRYGLNPCALGSMNLLTSEGYKTFESLEGKDFNVISYQGDVSKGKVWCSGIKPTIKLTFENRIQPLVCTKDHQLMLTTGETVLASDCKGLRLMPYTSAPLHDPLYVALGIIQGDGVLSDLKNYEKKGVVLCIGKLDGDFIEILKSAKLTFTLSQDGSQAYVSGKLKSLLLDLGFSSEKLPDRKLPSTFDSWTQLQQNAFLNGLFSANGCVHMSKSTYGRISLKSTNLDLIESVEKNLKAQGIETYVTTNKPRANRFANGAYQMKQSYDLNIQQYNSRLEFSRLINFSLEYRKENLESRLIETAPKVRMIQHYGEHKVYDFVEPVTHWGVVNSLVFHNCGEIVLQNNFCNLSEVHLNNLDPQDFKAQQEAFTAAGLSVAVLLNHKFVDPRYQASREIDPIVGVSFTGLFDFFVAAFGIEWLEWWQDGRPADWGMVDIHGAHQSRVFKEQEREYLEMWKLWATNSVRNYCHKHGLRVPNRCTAVQPAGSKSLLTGASCGFHPPKAAQYIRRITFAKNDPVALACINYGYTVVPSQSDKDLDGNLLDDPYSDLCTEWLVEIPVSVPWADLPGVDKIDISKFSALAQFDFAMQVQNYYVTHNLSATIELREDEIADLATAIYSNIQEDGGYISAALLARFDSLQTFPRLPFEPIDRDTYLRLSQQVLERRTRDFKEALDYYDGLDSTSAEALSGAAGCDGDKCLLPERKS